MEKETPQIQMNVDANSYVITGVNAVSDEELFHLAITSGNQIRQFAATPKHAKRIYLLLKQQIEAYEKKFGEIKTQLPQMPKNATEESKVGF